MSLLKTLTTKQPDNARAEALSHLVTSLFARTDETLKPPRRVYAILDGARDPGIVERVRACPGLHECLYRAVTDPELLEVAPWLVELNPHDEWSHDLLRDGWGRSWGIFVETATPPVALYRHLRTFLKAKDESGRSLLFRYYDPRVWRVYAPTCNAEEARTLTGPLSRFLCEDADGTALLAFARTSEGFAQTTTPLTGLRAAS